MSVSIGEDQLRKERGHQLDEIVQGWEEFRNNKDAWFGLLHGDILCHK